MFLFWRATSADLSGLSAPANALEMHVVAKQWMWKTQHSNGAREINALHVPVDRPVRLVMTSQDVIHSFDVPAFRVKRILPGRDTEIWFRATKTGVFPLLCAEYCGTDHSMMRGRIVVMRQEATPTGSARSPRATTSFMKARPSAAQGCSGCHANSSSVHAPKLTGLYGRTVSLSDGRQIKADDADIRYSILQPKARHRGRLPADHAGLCRLARRWRYPEPDTLHPVSGSAARHPNRRRRKVTDALLAGDLPLPPRPDYLRHGITLKSWLTTTDHKRIAILYAITITIFFFMGGVAITRCGWSCSRRMAGC